MRYDPIDNEMNRLRKADEQTKAIIEKSKKDRNNRK